MTRRFVFGSLAALATATAGLLVSSTNAADAKVSSCCCGDSCQCVDCKCNDGQCKGCGCGHNNACQCAGCDCGDAGSAS